MGFLDKMKEPVFLKDDSDAVKQLEALQELKKTVPKDKLSKLEQEIKAVNAGIFGEDSVTQIKLPSVLLTVAYNFYRASAQAGHRF